MKNHNVLSFILLAVIFYGCNGSKKAAEIIFSFDKTNFKTQYVDREELSLSVINSQNKKIDSIVYFVNDQRLDKKSDSEKVKLIIKDQKLGYQNIKARIYFEGKLKKLQSELKSFQMFNLNYLLTKLLEFIHMMSSHLQKDWNFIKTLYMKVLDKKELHISENMIMQLGKNTNK